jgi:hypothetical protein
MPSQTADEAIPSVEVGVLDVDVVDHSKIGANSNGGGRSQAGSDLQSKGL